MKRKDGFRKSESKDGVFSTRIEKDINEWLTDYCEKNNMNRTRYVNQLLRDAMNGQKAMYGDWTPTSDRLPDPNGCDDYLVTCAHYNPNFDGRFVTVDTYDARDEESAPSWIHTRDGIRVVAWMKIPHPYEGSKA